VPSHGLSAPGGFVGTDGLGAITTGPDGDLWFVETSVNRVGRINPSTHAIDEFFLPTPNSHPSGIAAGADGNLWITEAPGMNVTEFLTIQDSPPQFLPFGTTAVASITPATGAISPTPTPSFGAEPLGITLGPDGHLWFAETAADQIGEVTLRPDDGPQ